MRRFNSFAFYLSILAFVFLSLYFTFIYVVNINNGANKYYIYEPAYSFGNTSQRKIGECVVVMPIDYFPFKLQNHTLVYELSILADIKVTYLYENYSSRNCSFQKNIVSHQLYNHQFSFFLPSHRYSFTLPNDENDGKVQAFRTFSRGYYEIILPAHNNL